MLLTYTSLISFVACVLNIILCIKSYKLHKAFKKKMSKKLYLVHRTYKMNIIHTSLQQEVTLITFADSDEEAIKLFEEEYKEFEGYNYSKSELKVSEILLNKL